jgi:hypothetical protein
MMLEERSQPNVMVKSSRRRVEVVNPDIANEQHYVGFTLPASAANAMEGIR